MCGVDGVGQPEARCGSSHGWAPGAELLGVCWEVAWGPWVVGPQRFASISAAAVLGLWTRVTVTRVPEGVSCLAPLSVPSGRLACGSAQGVCVDRAPRPERVDRPQCVAGTIHGSCSLGTRGHGLPCRRPAGQGWKEPPCAGFHLCVHVVLTLVLGGLS